jgi:hypothetical protein
MCTCEQVIDALKADRNLGKNLEAPSVSYGAINLYMRGVLEEETKPNLSKVLHFILTMPTQAAVALLRCLLIDGLQVSIASRTFFKDARLTAAR